MNNDNFIKQSHWHFDGELWRLRLNEAEAESSFETWQADEIKKYEDISWWYTYRKEFLYMVCKRYFDPSKIVVDVGGGNGLVAGYLEEKGFDTRLVEPSYKSCKYALKRGVKKVYCGTVDAESIVDNSLPQLMLLDILEHIEDDESFYKMILDKMYLGGRLLVTVPAFMKLWSSEDVGSGHYRRYTVEHIRQLVNKIGGRIIFENYFFGFLYYPVLFGRVLSERIGFIKRLEDRDADEYEKERDRQYVNQNKLVEFVLKVFEKNEMNKIFKKKIRHGSSLVVVIEKV